MTLWATFMTALNSLRANRLRAFLALLGIVIGVCAVISLMSIGRGSQATITERIQNLGTNLLSISPQSGGVLTLEDAFALIDPIHTPSIKAVAPQISTFGTLIAGKKSSRTQIIGTTPEALSVRSFTMKSGIFISLPSSRIRTLKPSEESLSATTLPPAPALTITMLKISFNCLGTFSYPKINKSI